jgi:hypothetical protein
VRNQERLMPKVWETFESDDEKTMKKQFGKLSKAERAKIEIQYHRMSPRVAREAPEPRCGPIDNEIG